MKRFLCVLFPALLFSLNATAKDPYRFKVEVDATEISRSLIHCRMEFPVSSTEIVLWYPKWIPGHHAPGGPVQNIGGLYFETPDGHRLDWHRDNERMYRFICGVPEGATEVVVELDYICDQPSANSVGVDSYGNSLVGIVNWNTCLLYPEGYQDNEIEVDLSLNYPKGWRFGTRLKPKQESNGHVEFQRRDLLTVIDNPLIMGEYFRTIDLSIEDFPPHYLHLVSESRSAIEIKDEVIEKYRNLVREAKAMFGSSPAEEYHFLLVLSNQLPNMGLEHLESSLNGVSERALVEEKERKGWVAYLLPHEYVHSWCGKYRRPAGMFTQDYQTAKDTELLWVYEGLTQYLGEVLTVRCGLLDQGEYLDRFARKVSELMSKKGRSWRSLADTAISSYLLRAHSPHWSRLRRNQDYYDEGLLLWMEVDAILRQETDGRKSIDDFCQAFFGRKEEGQRILPFEVGEVFENLNDLAEYDWRAFILGWVNEPHESMPLDFVNRLGYKLAYESEPTEYLKENQKDGKYIAAPDSLGVYFSEDGAITGVVPGSVADDSGLSDGMKVLAINDRKFSRERVDDALSDSIAKGEVQLLVLDGDKIKEFDLDYSQGPKYLHLKRDDSRRDILKQILESQVEGKEKDDK
ncbi:MAG: hypothetical protein KC917_09450, partial [Candidatus Omnitrophica bacterium]|nr:hypothetical protein [Candidatus Omnitrophota bacterium]